MPSSLVKENIDILCPIISRLINSSLKSSIFPSTWKVAAVQSLIKKEGLDLIESNFRPVSNLPFLSKILETCAMQQLKQHTSTLIPVYQSAYRHNHSTETALLKLQYDLLRQMETGRVTAFVALDLSAAFDTVDHDVLLSKLNNRFGIKGSILEWMSSYLKPRRFFVNTNGSSSDILDLDFSVPQGSCLGPVLFTYYSSTLEDILRPFDLQLCGYADDHGAYDSFVPDSTEEYDALQNLETGLIDVQQWMNLNRFKMNATKTEFICFGGSKQLSKCKTTSISVCNSNVPRAIKIRYLGVWFDEILSFKYHISSIVKKTIFILIQIRSIRNFLSVEACKVI